MASVVTTQRGRRLIQFAVDGRRHTIRLAQASRRDAEAVRARIEDIIAARALGRAIDEDTAGWLKRIPEALMARIARTGLIPEGTAAAPPALGAFLADYIAGRPDVTRATQRIWWQVHAELIRQFGATQRIDAITPADIDAWRMSMVGRGLAENTIRKRTAIGSQFFRAAVRARWIDENPCAGLPQAVRPNESRQRFIGRPTIERILEACPDARWRAIVALARFAGLRCPSEALAMTWADVHLGDSWMRVSSPKTARHGMPSRRVPIFPELRPYLEDLAAIAAVGEIHVIARRGRGAANWRAGLAAICRRGGIEPWPRICHNLRASRQTELTAMWPEHVVCAWLGNSRAVARRHYLQVTEQDFRDAACGERRVQSPQEAG